ncbi:hypothetical protein RGU70_05805 [Herbaspirillum sp. RTI4]|uniref:hypothetical protein n=1 Tax=Herbaspirillum sp. RTI4 TaxID=3048640 RepID=UPI002AB36B8A|nr:hypothetical protein [Herbaspirillum sp. RTI4]MDY7577833.1 hypothetical protein [Herbaspirillum sp. RTI4]MEA9982451.1 hypothetical protein [Herbaspirillum sp. RTI4]
MSTISENGNPFSPAVFQAIESSGKKDSPAASRLTNRDAASASATRGTTEQPYTVADGNAFDVLAAAIRSPAMEMQWNDDASFMASKLASLQAGGKLSQNDLYRTMAMLDQWDIMNSGDELYARLGSRPEKSVQAMLKTEAPRLRQLINNRQDLIKATPLTAMPALPPKIAAALPGAELAKARKYFTSAVCARLFVNQHIGVLQERLARDSQTVMTGFQSILSAQFFSTLPSPASFPRKESEPGRADGRLQKSMQGLLQSTAREFYARYTEKGNSADLDGWIKTVAGKITMPAAASLVKTPFSVQIAEQLGKAFSETPLDAAILQTAFPHIFNDRNKLIAAAETVRTGQQTHRVFGAHISTAAGVAGMVDGGKLLAGGEELQPKDAYTARTAISNGVVYLFVGLAPPVDYAGFGTAKGFTENFKAGLSPALQAGWMNVSRSVSNPAGKIEKDRALAELNTLVVKETGSPAFSLKLQGRRLVFADATSALAALKKTGQNVGGGMAQVAAALYGTIQAGGLPETTVEEKNFKASEIAKQSIGAIGSSSHLLAAGIDTLTQGPRIAPKVLGAIGGIATLGGGIVDIGANIEKHLHATSSEERQEYGAQIGTSSANFVANAAVVGGTVLFAPVALASLVLPDWEQMRQAVNLGKLPEALRKQGLDQRAYWVQRKYVKAAINAGTGPIGSFVTSLVNGSIDDNEKKFMRQGGVFAYLNEENAIDRKENEKIAQHVLGLYPHIQKVNVITLRDNVFGIGSKDKSVTNAAPVNVEQSFPQTGFHPDLTTPQAVWPIIVGSGSLASAFSATNPSPFKGPQFGPAASSDPRSPFDAHAVFMEGPAAGVLTGSQAWPIYSPRAMHSSVPMRNEENLIEPMYKGDGSYYAARPIYPLGDLPPAGQMRVGAAATQSTTATITTMTREGAMASPLTRFVTGGQPEIDFTGAKDDGATLYLIRRSLLSIPGKDQALTPTTSAIRIAGQVAQDHIQELSVDAPNERLQIYRGTTLLASAGRSAASLPSASKPVPPAPVFSPLARFPLVPERQVVAAPGYVQPIPLMVGAVAHSSSPSKTEPESTAGTWRVGDTLLGGRFARNPASRSRA